jgi:hypothetical protein
MQTTDSTADGHRFQVRTRGLSIAVAIAIALLLGLGIKLWLDHRVPSPDAEPARLAHYMTTPAFAALPDAQKAPYLAAFQSAADRGQLTPRQQDDVMRNIMHRKGSNPIERYFSLPPREREKFLDDVIDRVLKSEKERKLPPPPADKKGTKPMRFDGGRLADSIPPEDRAMMNQFLQDLHDRRMARGVPDDGKFLFNRAD